MNLSTICGFQLCSEYPPPHPLCSFFFVFQQSGYNNSLCQCPPDASYYYYYLPITWMYYIPVSYASCFLLVMFNLMFAPIPSCHTNDQKGSLFSHTLGSTDMPKQERFLSPVWSCVRYAQKRISGLSIFGNVVCPVLKCVTLAQTYSCRPLCAEFFAQTSSSQPAARWGFLHSILFVIYCFVSYLLWYLIFLFNCI